MGVKADKIFAEVAVGNLALLKEINSFIQSLRNPVQRRIRIGIAQYRRYIQLIFDQCQQQLCLPTGLS